MATKKDECIIMCTDTETGDRYSVRCNGEEVIITHYRTVLKPWARVVGFILLVAIIIGLGILVATSIYNRMRDVACACDARAGYTCSWYEVEKFPKMSEEEKRIMFDN